MVIDTNKFQFIELIFFVENFQKCSTLYFQKKVVCFAKQKEMQLFERKKNPKKFFRIFCLGTMQFFIIQTLVRVFVISTKIWEALSPRRKDQKWNFDKLFL
jgi:hypothetical protein